MFALESKASVFSFAFEKTLFFSYASKRKNRNVQETPKMFLLTAV